MDSKLVVRSSRSSCRSLEGEIGLVKGVNEDILDESDGTPKRGGHGRRRRFKASSNRRMGEEGESVGNYSGENRLECLCYVKRSKVAK